MADHLPLPDDLIEPSPSLDLEQWAMHGLLVAHHHRADGAHHDRSQATLHVIEYLERTSSSGASTTAPVKSWRALRPLTLAACVGCVLFASAAAYAFHHLRSLSLRPVSVTRIDGDLKAILVVFSDGSERQLNFGSPVAPPLIAQASDGPLLFVGTGAAGTEPSRLIAIKFSPEPVRIFDRKLAEQPPWKHQKFNRRCHVKPTLAGDLNNQPGDELVVTVNHDQGPMEIIVFDTTTWRRLSTGWHYGHMPNAFPRDVNGDGRFEVLFVGIANERPPNPAFGAIHEPLRAAIMVIDPLRKDTWAWSMNAWMNDPKQRPLAYGVLHQNDDSFSSISEMLK